MNPPVKHWRYYYNEDIVFNGVYFEIDMYDVFPFQEIFSVTLNDSPVKKYEIDYLNKKMIIESCNAELLDLINDKDKNALITVGYFKSILADE